MPERSRLDDLLEWLVSTVRRWSVAAGGRYRVTPMRAIYVGEEIPKPPLTTAVTYLTPSQRAAYALTFRNGQICDAAGNPYDTGDADTLFSDGRAIFIMDADGNFFASKYQAFGVFHHSSLAAGGPVAAAGEIEVVNGVLTALSDKSGHYWPARRFTAQAIDQLKKNNISLDRVPVDRFSPI